MYALMNESAWLVRQRVTLLAPPSESALTISGLKVPLWDGYRQCHEARQSTGWGQTVNLDLYTLRRPCGCIRNSCRVGSCAVQGPGATLQSRNRSLSI